MLQHTTKIIEVKDYPYGRLRTSMFFSVEFQKGKGFRSVRQSINPKTGVLNKPKKSTYNHIIVLDETDGFCTFVHQEFYHVEKLNELCTWISTNWGLFTTEQRQELYRNLLAFLRVEAQSICTYCGSKPEDVLPLLEATTQLAVEGMKNPDIDVFSRVHLDSEALNNTKIEGYKPFTVTEYGI